MKSIHPTPHDIRRQLHVSTVNARAIADAPSSLRISLAAADSGFAARHVRRLKQQKV
jgi:hypothetical protein